MASTALRIALCASLLAPAMGIAAIAEPTGLQPRLRALPDEEPAFMLTANGVHVYECRAAPGRSGGYAWTFTNPDATLFEGSRSIGTQSAPNLWESSSDRSSVSAVVQATQPAGDANLPWTSMRAQSASETGLFSGVTRVQRVNTVGGVAPASGCSEDSVGSEVRVQFSADYYFYKRRG